MAFRGKVHHVRRLELRKHAVQLAAVADVNLLELEAVGLCDRGEIFEISCVGELVDYAHIIRRVVDDMLTQSLLRFFSVSSLSGFLYCFNISS